MDKLAEALAPVLRDVRATTAVKLALRYDVDELGPFVWVLTVDGFGAGLHIDDETLDERIAYAADAVQEIVIEELWGQGSNWPICPNHPSTHPMAARWTPAGPRWICPAGGSSQVAIGSLER